MPDKTDTPEIRDEDPAYDPSTPQANRSIEQGNGVGARDLDAQADPTEITRHDPFKEDPRLAEAAQRSQG